MRIQARGRKRATGIGRRTPQVPVRRRGLHPVVVGTYEQEDTPVALVTVPPLEGVVPSLNLRLGDGKTPRVRVRVPFRDSNSSPVITEDPGIPPARPETVPVPVTLPSSTESPSALQARLDGVNRHFRRKTASVLNDNEARRLLTTLYSKVVVRTADFDFCEDGRSLAKLTAAHLAEVGANGVYITDRGQRLVASRNAG